MRAVALALLAASLVLTSSAQQPSTAHKATMGTIVIQLRDVETGYGVEGTVGFAPAPGPWQQYLAWERRDTSAQKIEFKERKTDASGRLKLIVPAGSYLLEVNAPGYGISRAPSGVAAGTTAPITFELDPIEKPPDMKDIDRFARPGFASAVGYVIDSQTLHPVAGAELRDKDTGVTATTNSRGFYALQIPLTPEEKDDPCHDTLRWLSVTAPGYKDFVRKHDLLYTNDLAIGIQFELDPGTGTVENTGPDDWDPRAVAPPVPQNAWWNVKPIRPSKRQPSEEVRKWQSLAPQIEKALSSLRPECPGGYGIEGAVVDAAKFPNNGPDIALVEVCPMGAYTSWILPMRIENGKPVIVNSRPKGGKLLPFELAMGSSIKNTADVHLVPEDKAIYSIEYHTDGCRYLLYCRVTASAWDNNAKTFVSDPALSRQGRKGYCSSVQEGLKRTPRNAP